MNSVQIQRGAAAAIEALETRTLLSATSSSTIPTVQEPAGSSPVTLNLNSYFSDPQVTGPEVLMQTNEGNIPINLYESQVKATVDNFLSYVTPGDYNNTIFHRVITMAQGGIGIVQGGGYTTSLNALTPGPEINLQYDLPNVAGTIAMARTSDPNSATDEWFFNVTDNSQTLGQSNGGGYAVFGDVIDGGMNAVNTIYNLPQTTAETSDGQTQSNLPVLNSSGGTGVDNLVVVESATKLTAPLTFVATSDNNALVTPAISGNSLTLNYTAGQIGTANITVTATDAGGGSVAQTFAVSVGGVATTQATIGKGAAHIVHFVDPNGVAGTATLAGPGTATLTFIGAGVSASTDKTGVETVTGTPQSITISTTGTSTASALNITGAVSLAGISTDASIGSITASRATLAGGLAIAGTVGTMNLNAVSGGTIAVDGSGRSLALRVGSATGESVSSAGTIASITAGSWTTGGGMSATAINRIADTGELNAEISTPTLGLVTAGSITSSTWAISGKLTGITAGSITGLNLSAGVIGPITDRGAAQGDAITTTGNIGAITALSMSGTRIEAGVDSADANGLATAFSANDKISSVVIGKGGFSNSVIDAETLSRVSLGTLSSSNGGVPFGLASSDIVSLTATIDGKRVTISRAASADVVTAALAKAGVTLTDMVIRIV